MLETRKLHHLIFGNSRGNNEKESLEAAAVTSKHRSRNIYHHRSVKSHHPKKTINTATNTFRLNQIHALTIRDMNFDERTDALGFLKTMSYQMNSLLNQETGIFLMIVSLVLWSIRCFLVQNQASF